MVLLSRSPMMTTLGQLIDFGTWRYQDGNHNGYIVSQSDNTKSSDDTEGCKLRQRDAIKAYIHDFFKYLKSGDASLFAQLESFEGELNQRFDNVYAEKYRQYILIRLGYSFAEVNQILSDTDRGLKNLLSEFLDHYTKFFNEQSLFPDCKKEEANIHGTYYVSTYSHRRILPAMIGFIMEESLESYSNSVDEKSEVISRCHSSHGKCAIWEDPPYKFVSRFLGQMERGESSIVYELVSILNSLVQRIETVCQISLGSESYLRCSECNNLDRPFSNSCLEFWKQCEDEDELYGRVDLRDKHIVGPLTLPYLDQHLYPMNTRDGSLSKAQTWLDSL
ncbi:MAG: hypothetical protein HRU09_02480 [Oligoflexales bacterium]|nr:hypothetical protein [Oligoflexales bacterium]